MQEPLTAETIHKLDAGAAGVAIDSALRIAVHDLEDRGQDGKSRKVVITLELAKADKGRGRVISRVTANCSLPPLASGLTLHRSRINPATGQEELLFQEDAPDNPDQRTLSDFVPGTKKKEE